MMDLKFGKTHRGFTLITFDDRYKKSCSVQDSSLATEAAIWLGLEDANPQVMASQASQVGVHTEETTGWVKYPIPDQVSLDTRMHLTLEQVEKLIPILQHFVDTGYLPQKKIRHQGLT